MVLVEILANNRTLKIFSLETSEQIDILGFLKIINCKLSYYDINNNTNNNNNVI